AARGVSVQKKLASIAKGEARVELAAPARERARPHLARLHAVWALGILQREHPDLDHAWLSELLSDKDDEVRAQAARVAGDLRLAGTASRCIELLRDPSPRVRMFAAIALARCPVPAAVEPLFELV